MQRSQQEVLHRSIMAMEVNRRRDPNKWCIVDVSNAEELYTHD